MASLVNKVWIKFIFYHQDNREVTLKYDIGEWFFLKPNGIKNVVTEDLRLVEMWQCKSGE